MVPAAFRVVQCSRAGVHHAVRLAAIMALTVTAGRLEGQGLPVRAAIGARATVLPMPAPSAARTDTVSVLAATLAPPRAFPVRADSAQAAGTLRRPRRIVVSYPGT